MSSRPAPKTSNRTSARRAHPSPSPDQLDAIATFFSVLADITRLGIINHLRDGPATVSEIMAAMGIKQSNASKQLGILHRARLLSRRQVGSQVQYAIAEPMLFDLCELVCGKLRRDLENAVDALGGTLKLPARSA